MTGRRPATAGDVLRSLAFHALFYPGTVVLLAIIAVQLLLPGRGIVGSIGWWTRYHRWCVTRLLGIRVRVEGEVPDGPVLVAMKHESFFEAIDLPMLLHRPAVFAEPAQPHSTQQHTPQPAQTSQQHRSPFRTPPPACQEPVRC